MHTVPESHDNDIFKEHRLHYLALVGDYLLFVLLDGFTDATPLPSDRVPVDVEVFLNVWVLLAWPELNRTHFHAVRGQALEDALDHIHALIEFIEFRK